MSTFFAAIVLFAESVAQLHGPGAHIPIPVVFGQGVISTGDYETHPAFSPGGDTLYFLKAPPDFSTWTLCVSFYRDGTWYAPEVLPFSGQYQDADPFVTKDGSELYFISNRPLHAGDPPKDDFDIWKVAITRSGWTTPSHPDPPLNSTYDEFYPTIADSGTIYFGSRRPGGKGECDIWRSERINGTYREPENLGDSVNTPDNEYEPFIAPDESYLIFMTTRPNGLSNADFYMSRREGGRWTRARKLASPVNSGVTDWSPKVTRDGKYFFFGSVRSIPYSPAKETTPEFMNRIRGPGNGLGDIYQVDFSSLTYAQEEPVPDELEIDRKTLGELNARFIRNFINKDSVSHDAIIHKDFVCIESSGEIVGRDRYLKEWAGAYDSSGYASFEYTDETIRIFGSVALIRSKTVYTKNEGGKVIHGNSVYTDTYLKENGKWLCIQAQITPVKR